MPGGEVQLGTLQRLYVSGPQMRCPKFAAQTPVRHDILKGILRQVVHFAGVAHCCSHCFAGSLD
jgi:hypothetical protein